MAPSNQRHAAVVQGGHRHYTTSERIAPAFVRLAFIPRLKPWAFPLAFVSRRRIAAFSRCWNSELVMSHLQILFGESRPVEPLADVRRPRRGGRKVEGGHRVARPLKVAAHVRQPLAARGARHLLAHHQRGAADGDQLGEDRPEMAFVRLSQLLARMRKWGTRARPRPKRPVLGKPREPLGQRPSRYAVEEMTLDEPLEVFRLDIKNRPLVDLPVGDQPHADQLARPSVGLGVVVVVVVEVAHFSTRQPFGPPPILALRATKWPLPPQTAQAFFASSSIPWHAGQGMSTGTDSFVLARSGAAGSGPGDFCLSASSSRKWVMALADLGAKSSENLGTMTGGGETTVSLGQQSAQQCSLSHLLLASGGP